MADVYLADSDGRLRLESGEGNCGGAGSRATARRTRAFVGKRSIRVNLGGEPRAGLLVTPLVCRGEALGLVEVLAPMHLIDRRRGALEAAASQAAIALRNGRQQNELRSQVGRLEELAACIREIGRAPSRLRAARSLAGAVFASFGMPVAVWIDETDGDRLRLSVTRGLGRRRRTELRAQMSILPDLVLPKSALSSLQEQLSDVIGAPDVEILDEGAFVAVIGSAVDPELSQWLDAVRSSIREMLERTVQGSPRQRVVDLLEEGIAWAAHELRTPLIGAQVVIERASRAMDPSSEVQLLLRRSQQELRRHEDVVSFILRWSVDRRSLHRRPSSLVRIVAEAIRRASLDAIGGRILLLPSDDVLVKANRPYLVVAVANVIRNALTYSPDGSRVRVEVRREGDLASVAVTDRGPGVPREEWDSIFEPFTRGRVAGRRSRGAGLGLFIARQVVQAHEGTIRLDSNSFGTTFHIQLPAAK
jgi:signal transduction histidine kinase